MAFLKELKKAVYFFVPVGIDRLIHKQKAKKIEKKQQKNYSNEIERFNINVEEGEQCVILGNGPSLKDSLTGETLKFIKERKKFCVNESALSDEFLELKPEYLVFMDPYYWSPKTAEPCLSRYKKIAEILSNIDWEITLFLPNYAKDWNFFIEVPSKNKNVQIVYVNTNMSMSDENESRFLEYKQNLSMPRVQNVLVACIYLAINAGFKNSYIFGADHSWHETIQVREDNVVCLKDKHFYDKKELTIYTPAYKNPEETETWTMSGFFEAFSYKHKSYEELELYSKYMGAKIYNSSAYSCVDAFERKKV